MAEKSQLKLPTTWTEDFAPQVGKPRVDREKGIIYGVKVCGLSSLNGRQYPLSTHRAALGMYEGKACRLNHPAKPQPGQPPSYAVEHTIGELTSPQLHDDGTYADLRYNREHPWANWLAEQCENFPNHLGCSHVVAGDEEFKDGRKIVTKIHEVRSVDLVGTPATTRNIFEGQITEAGPMGAMGGAGGEMPYGDVGGGGDEAVTGGFKQAAMAIIEQAFASGADPKDILKKLKKLLSAHGEVTGMNDTAVPGESDVQTESVQPPDLETLKAENAKLKTKLGIITFCESQGFQPNEIQRKALEGLETEDDRKLLVESFRKPAPVFTSTARSSAPQGQRNGTSNRPPETVEEAGRRWYARR